MSKILKSLPVLLEAVLVCLVFAALAAGPVPEVNESHYWTKAKSFWDPGYGARDLFLQSADAHYVFYLTLGLLAAPLKLPAAVWAARWIVWFSMACGWTSLSRSVSRPFGVAILSGGLLVAFTRWFHLAGEWVVGGAEAKGLAFACVFFALGQACRRRWGWAWIWGGAAAAFHVLVGGWVVLAMLGVVAWQFLSPEKCDLELAGDTIPDPTPAVKRSGLLFHWLGLLVGGGLSLLGLLPAVALNWNVPPEVSLAGARIYSIDRIAHHLAIWAFSPGRILAFCFLLLVWLVLATLILFPHDKAGGVVRRAPAPLRRLLGISLGSIVIAAVGLLIGIGVLRSDLQWDTGVSLLRFYWFRCADFLVPAVVALAPFAILFPHDSKDDHWLPESVLRRRSVWSFGICLLATGFIVGEGAVFWRQLYRDPRPAADRMSLPGNMDARRTQQYYQNWVRVCEWVRENTSQDALFLTPRSQQTFKWYSGRAEVICWKDVPQDSRSMLEWMQRAADCFPHTESEWGFAINQPEQLERVIKKYQVDYLLIPQYAYELKDRFGRPLPYPMVYPKSPEQRSTFVVLDVRPQATASQPSGEVSRDTP